MSAYLTSFVVEPVLRQARRLSRASSSSDRPSSTAPRVILSHENRLAATRSGTGDIEDEAVDTMEDVLIERGATIHNSTMDTTVASPISTILESGSMVESPTREDGGLDAQLESLQQQQGQRQSAPPTASSSMTSTAVRRQRAGTTASSTTRGHSSVTVDEETTSNPSFGIPDRFAVSNGPIMTPSYTNLQVSSDTDMSTDHPSSSTSHRRTSSISPPSRTSSNTTTRPRPRNSTTSLPADDGMSSLRAAIIHIRELDISPLDKARRMHELMTAQYISSKHSSTVSPRPHSPASVRSGGDGAGDRPLTPTAAVDGGRGTSGGQPPLTPTSMSSADCAERDGTGSEYNLTVEDLKPTFIPDTKSSSSESNVATAPLPKPSTHIDDLEEEEEADKLRFGCQHYKRNVKLQCSTCQRWYTCRFCHDEVENHALVRRDTKHMLCMLCGCAQPAGAECTDCGVRSAWYYCDVCKLWDDDVNKTIYHCNDCGICRVGRGLGKDFFHCKTCGVCMSIAVADFHRCIERSTDCDCPICGEYMFTSPEAVVFMPCGHSIHQKCYYQHMKASYRCPICSRSVVNMETQFRNLDRAIEQQPMPAQWKDTRALVHCNDCSAKSDVRYHWLGLKCGNCSSYNTAQIQILNSDSRPETETLPEPHAEGPLLIPNLGDAGQPTQSSSTTTAAATNSAGTPTTDPSSSQTATPIPVPQPVTSPPGHLSPNVPNGTASTATEDIDDEDEEMDFWGGESPRERRLNSVQMQTAPVIEHGDPPPNRGEGNVEDDWDEDFDDDDDDVDSQMDIISDDGSAEELDEMDLIGHR